MAEKGALPLSATSLPRVNHVPCAPGGFGDQGSVEIPSTALPAAPIAVHSLCFRSREKRLPRSGRVTAHYCYKSFNCNTCGSPRKCCKQKTYGPAKPFRCNTTKCIRSNTNEYTDQHSIQMTYVLQNLPQRTSTNHRF